MNIYKDNDLIVNYLDKYVVYSEFTCSKLVENFIDFIMVMREIKDNAISNMELK